MLLGEQVVVLERLALRQLGQLGVILAVVPAPDPIEAVEHQHRAGGPEDERAALDLDLGVVVDGGRHPAGDEAAPDQVVEAVLVVLQVGTDVLWPAVGVGGPDRLVGLLGARPRLLGPVRAQVALTHRAFDEGPDACLRLG